MGGKRTTIPINKARFENALKKAGISKYRLAKELKIDLRNLQRCINEKQALSYQNLVQACKLLEIHPDYITKNNSWTRDEIEKISPDWANYLSDKFDQDGVYMGSFSGYAESNSTKQAREDLEKVLFTISKNSSYFHSWNYRDGIREKNKYLQEYIHTHIDHLEDLLLTSIFDDIEESEG